MIKFDDKVLETDKEGYLLHQHEWNELVAEYIAKQEGIVLTEEHWLIIHFVRQFYLQYNTSPAIRMLVMAVKQQFGEQKGNSRYLQRLFPKGPAKQATKIAGLPKPVKCI